LGVILAISKYSTLEKNLNIKTYLEDAAERVLVVPAQMINMVKKLELMHGVGIVDIK